MVNMCYDMQEAQEVLQLQSLVEQLDLTQSTQELATSIGSSSEVQRVLNCIPYFYPVTDGIKEVAFIKIGMLHACCIHPLLALNQVQVDTQAFGHWLICQIQEN